MLTVQKVEGRPSESCSCGQRDLGRCLQAVAGELIIQSVLEAVQGCSQGYQWRFRRMLGRTQALATGGEALLPAEQIVQAWLGQGQRILPGQVIQLRALLAARCEARGARDFVPAARVEVACDLRNTGHARHELAKQRRALPLSLLSVGVL